MDDLAFIEKHDLSLTYLSGVYTVSNPRPVGLLGAYALQGAGPTLTEALTTYMALTSDDRVESPASAVLDAYVSEPEADKAVVRAVKEGITIAEARKAVAADAVEAIELPPIEDVPVEREP